MRIFYILLFVVGLSFLHLLVRENPHFRHVPRDAEVPRALSRALEAPSPKALANLEIETPSPKAVEIETPAPKAVEIEPPSPLAKSRGSQLDQERHLVGVLSRRSAFETRRAIRETWAAGHRNVIFIVGACCPIPPSDRNKWTCIRAQETSPAEQRKWDAACLEEDRRLREHDDVIHMPDTDVYRHLPQKVKFLYAWALAHTNAQWIVKTDDDSVVRIDTLEDYLTRTYAASAAVVLPAFSAPHDSPPAPSLPPAPSPHGL